MRIKLLETFWLCLQSEDCVTTHIMSVEAGVSSNMIHRMNFEACSEPEKLVGVMLDEMRIKSGQVFDRR